MLASMLPLAFEPHFGSCRCCYFASIVFKNGTADAANGGLQHDHPQHWCQLFNGHTHITLGWLDDVSGIVLSRYLRAKASAAVFMYAGGLARRAFYAWAAYAVQQRIVRSKLGRALLAVGGLKKEMVFYRQVCVCLLTWACATCCNLDQRNSQILTCKLGLSLWHDTTSLQHPLAFGNGPSALE